MNRDIEPWSEWNQELTVSLPKMGFGWSSIGSTQWRRLSQGFVSSIWKCALLFHSRDRRAFEANHCRSRDQPSAWYRVGRKKLNLVDLIDLAETIRYWSEYKLIRLMMFIRLTWSNGAYLRWVMNLFKTVFDNWISPIASLALMRHLINKTERKEAFEENGVLCQIRIIGQDAFVKA